MKNENGITLVSLIVTVIVLIMLAGISVGETYNSLKDVRDNDSLVELGIVRHAITEEYSKNIVLNTNNFVGEKIDNVSKKIDLPIKSNLSETSEEIDDFYTNAQIYSFENLDDYYYRLSPANLENIGIEDSEETYIVNYKTGEVYNETKKTTSSSKLLYLPSTLNN